MTIHVRYSHECESCKAKYIPYDFDVPCPKCGLVEQERFDFIPRAIASMKLNKSVGGSYGPSVWTVTGLGDWVLNVLFSLFDQFEKQQGQTAFEPFMDEALGRMNLDGLEYMRGHLRGIALRVREELTLA